MSALNNVAIWNTMVSGGCGTEDPKGFAAVSGGCGTEDPKGFAAVSGGCGTEDPQA